jgi:hypothetical protein
MTFLPTNCAIARRASCLGWPFALAGAKGARIASGPMKISHSLSLTAGFACLLALCPAHQAIAADNDGSPSGATPITAEVSPAPQNPRLANLSARALVGKGQNGLIGGFIITGNAPKDVIVRALGPSLAVTPKLPNPQLSFYRLPSGNVGFNDNWMNSPDKQLIMDSTVAPTNDLEAALISSLPPNAYSTVVYGEGPLDVGIGSIEIYDLEPNSDSKLANISARGVVQSGDNILIGGFIATGQSIRVLIRALGPSLGLSGALADPVLELRDSNGSLVAFNNNWRSNQEAEISATTIPPPNDAESAIVQVLSPGGYSALIRGVNNTSGLALIEIYALN